MYIYTYIYTHSIRITEHHVPIPTYIHIYAPALEIIIHIYTYIYAHSIRITEHDVPIPTYIHIYAPALQTAAPTVFMVWPRPCPPVQYRHNTVVRPVQVPATSFLIHHLPVMLTQQEYSLGYWQRNEITNHDTPFGVSFTEMGDTL